MRRAGRRRASDQDSRGRSHRHCAEPGSWSGSGVTAACPWPSSRAPTTCRPSPSTATSSGWRATGWSSGCTAARAPSTAPRRRTAPRSRRPGPSAWRRPARPRRRSPPTCPARSTTARPSSWTPRPACSRWRSGWPGSRPTISRWSRTRRPSPTSSRPRRSTSSSAPASWTSTCGCSPGTGPWSSCRSSTSTWPSSPPPASRWSQGLTTSRRPLADVINTARASAERTVGLIDATKFGRASLLSFARAAGTRLDRHRLRAGAGDGARSTGRRRAAGDREHRGRKP